ncbi:hypothetical protein UFOVP450_157 [uncultured Caudovirales phage]|uniref:Uncharacterized protein n=1 Tax=uncultured Caudovirales phage TaxID=2100421 RepID=A0A6J5MDR8_9CAUD|nr:hypothetical protein UFOVP450_157 [uncultured Caudovirales phage]
MAEIYKNFNAADDIIVGDIQVVSSPLWSENVNPLSGGYASGIGFFTSSTQQQVAGNYYTDVYHRSPATSTNAAVQFAIAYGNRNGSGSVGDPNTVGQNANDTPTRAVYSQYRNLLLPPTDTAFTFGTGNAAVTPNDIFVININRARYRQKIDPGNWEIRIASGSGHLSGSGGTGSYISLIDNSGANTDPSVGSAGRIFSIMSGSGGITTGSQVYGLFYPDAGVMIFNASLLSSSLGMAPTTEFNTGAASNTVKNAVSLFSRISASSYFAARSEEKVNSTHYFVRITNKQFNFSNNPTFVSGSNGTFVHTSMLRNPSVYVTSIGMYDDQNRLLAVAKLSQPLLKTFNREVLVKVKLDY